VRAITTPVLDLLQTPALFTAFSIVIGTDQTFAELQALNAACRLARVGFYGAATLGLYGYVFADLLTHDFVIERERSNVAARVGPETTTRSVTRSSTTRGDDGRLRELVAKRELYSPLALAATAPLPAANTASRRRRLRVSPALSCVRALWDFQIRTARLFPVLEEAPATAAASPSSPSSSSSDLRTFTTLATAQHQMLALPPETLRADFIRSFMQGCGAELAPTCAILGGELAQDVIDVVGGRREQPIQNLLVWDGEEVRGEIYAMHPLPAVSDADVDFAVAGGVGLDGTGMGMGMGMDGTGIGGIGMGADIRIGIGEA